MRPPTTFISYSWDSPEHKKWVAELAATLRSDGVETRLDQWHAIPGDQLPQFMETEIRENDFVLVICTPNYREKADGRKGGVGYEGDIMTGEVHTRQNHRKFIPILVSGNWKASAPSWLTGKYYIDLRSAEKYDEAYSDLLTTLLGERVSAPPVRTTVSSQRRRLSTEKNHQDSEAPIRILGIITDEVTEPRGDGTKGSALYRIPFKLSKRPNPLWADLFVNTWNMPPRFSGMHRPRIASVSGAKIILDGTTIEEVKLYHRDTLVLCVEEANKKEAGIIAEQARIEEQKRLKSKGHRDVIEKGARDIEF